MRKDISLLIVLLCFLSLNTLSAQSPQKTAAPKMPVKSDKMTFEQFFDKFAHDPKFQKSHTTFPLKTTVTDTEAPDSVIILKEKDWEFDDLTNAETYECDIEVNQEEAENGGYKVEIKGVDTGVQVFYHFARKDDTWTLVLIEDYSN